MERKKFLKQNSQNKWQKRGLEDNYFKLPFSQNILPKMLRIFAKNVESAQCHNLKDNLSLYDIENAIKTDIYFDCGVPCDSCMRMSKGFCTIIVNKGKICGRDNGYPFWIFPYRYWNKVMKHDNEIFG